MAWSDALQRSLMGTVGSTVGGMGAAGSRDTGELSQYFRTLLGGDRAATARLVAPGANAAIEAADAAKRERAARGTARTGGTAAQDVQSEDEKRKALDTMIGQAQSGAAGGLQNVSNTELSQMMNALNIGSSTAQSDINSRRAASAQMWSSLISGATGLASGGLMAHAIGSMGGGGGGAGGGGGGGSVAPSLIPLVSRPQPEMMPILRELPYYGDTPISTQPYMTG